MTSREMILDGLAWASYTESTRVAKISALLVREGNYKLTKTRIKEAVKETSPPYGRGKAITEQVETEVYRQKRIYDQRQKAQTDFKSWLQIKATLRIRLNDAYAHAFSRVPYDPNRRYPGSYHGDYEARREWEAQESARDKGDECIAVTHWQEHVVALLRGINGEHRNCVATRLRKGETVLTYLRGDARDLSQAAISLGGPKVRAAFAQGIRVTTDWVGRKTTVHYTDRREVELPWRSLRYEEQENEGGYVTLHRVPILIHGTTVTDDGEPVDDLLGDDY